MTNKKHILILPRWYPNKFDVQLGVFIQKQAQLLAQDFHVHVIYVHADPELDEPYKIDRKTKEGVDEQIVYFKSSTGGFRKAINGGKYRKAQKLAYANIGDQIALCHVHVPYRSAFLALDLQKDGIPFVITEHWSGHLNGDYLLKNSLDKKIYKKVLGRASKIACVSEHLAHAFKKNTGTNPIVIPNYIEKGKLISYTPTADKVNILSVSDMNDAVKNISGLLRSFKNALAENSRLRLKLVGGGPDEEMIRKMISKLNLQELVKMEGRKSNEEVLNLMQECDFYVCNSNFETFGMTVAEALIHGKPVICTKCGGPEEFVSNKNGILINSNDEVGLHKAMIEMSRKFTDFNAIAIAEEIEQKFGKEAVRKKLIEFYKI